MKPIVVDTNIIFSALRAKDSYTRSKLLTKSYKLYTPNFLMVEIFRHKERILQKAKANEEMDSTTFLMRKKKKNKNGL